MARVGVTQPSGRDRQEKMGAVAVGVSVGDGVKEGLIVAEGLAVAVGVNVGDGVEEGLTVVEGLHEDTSALLPGDAH